MKTCFVILLLFTPLFHPVSTIVTPKQSDRDTVHVSDQIIEGNTHHGRAQQSLSTKIHMATLNRLNEIFRRSLRMRLDNMMHQVRDHYESGSKKLVRTRTTICREFDENAQSCLFEGVSCVEKETSAVYLVNDYEKDFGDVKSDNWCSYRHQSADPKYFASRHWPIMNDTLLPQRSCMKAQYIRSATLEQLKKQKKYTGNPVNISIGDIQWVPQLSLVNLDYAEHPHNNHLLKDIIWLLDISLFQDSLSGVLYHGGTESSKKKVNDKLNIFQPYEKILLPQTRKQFEKQTSSDLNRLMYAIILQKPILQLYSSPNSTSPRSSLPSKKKTSELFTAYPELSSQLVFRNGTSDNRSSSKSSTDLLCTPKLLVGAKIGDAGHERVCRYIRSVSYEAFNITRPQVLRVGQIKFPRPARRVLILDRHVSRRIENIDMVMEQLERKLGPIQIELQYATTGDLSTAQDYVKTYSSAGVIVTPHGSHNMGLLWMQRHSALIEVMPVGYTDYAFNLLSQSCRIWYYELPSVAQPKAMRKLRKECGNKSPHMLNPCVAVKSDNVWIDVSKVYDMIILALERLGHDTNSWPGDSNQR